MQKFKKIILVSTCCFLSTIVFGFLGFNSIVKFVVRDQTALKKRNIMRKFYLKIPIPMDFSVYFFNISNPMGVQRGEIPILKEIGPYSYDAFKEKIDVMDNAGEDSLSYTPYETYFFNQDRSGGLRDDDEITIIHPLIVGMVNLVLRDAPPLLVVVNKALKSLFQDPKSIYFTTKVKDILFEGIEIKCDQKDFATKAVCTQIKAQVPGLTEVGKNIYKFSLLGPRNGTLPERIKVFRGIRKSSELGRFVERNHAKIQTVWSTKRCNRYRGTDGWIFPPFSDKNEGIWVFAIDLCRSIHLQYVKDTVMHGIPLEKYSADLGDMSTNPAEKCYCPSPKNCLSKGVFDVTKCMGVPILVTLPHFLRTDEKYLKLVKGLQPNTDDHGIHVFMQPLLGVPLSAVRALQFNLPIQAVDKIPLMKTLPEALHPVFWIREAIDLNGPPLKMLKTVFIALKVFAVFKYFLLVITLGGVCYGFYLYYGVKFNHRPLTAAVTPVVAVNDNNAEEDSNYKKSANKEIISSPPKLF